MAMRLLLRLLLLLLLLLLPAAVLLLLLLLCAHVSLDQNWRPARASLRFQCESECRCETPAGLGAGVINRVLGIQYLDP